MLGFSGAFQDPADAAAERNAQIVQQLSRTSSPYIPDPATMGGYLNNPSAHANCDIKPRLTKEQHDVLEAHYQKQNKPSTVTKKGFAESLNVSLEKVNVCVGRDVLSRSLLIVATELVSEPTRQE